MTKKQAREIAEEQAMLNAVEYTFATYAEQQSDIHVKELRVKKT